MQTLNLRPMVAAAATAALFLTAPLSEAATVTFSALPSTDVPMPFAVATGGANGVVHENIVGSLANEYKSPWSGTALADTGHYTSIQHDSWATYAADQLSQLLSFVWGSPDTYNKIEFLLGGSVIETVQLSASTIIDPATWGDMGATVTITDVGTFDAVTFHSIGANSFEIANLEIAPVPLPAAGLMLLAGLGGFAAVRRRK